FRSRRGPFSRVPATAHLDHLRVGLFGLHIGEDQDADEQRRDQNQERDQYRHGLLHLLSAGPRKVMGIASDSRSGTVLIRMVKWLTSSSCRPRGREISNSPAADSPGCTRTGLGARASDAPGRFWMVKVTAPGLPPRLAMR